MPDFTVPPGWEGPFEDDGDIKYRKYCLLDQDDPLKMQVFFDKSNHQRCALLLYSLEGSFGFCMKSVQDAFNVAEAISAGLWTEAEHA